MQNSTYFSSLGYKWSIAQSDFIIKDFQRHAGLDDDGVIGPLTKAKIDYYNYANFCPEVFESIKPYITYTDEQIESLMHSHLMNYGKVFNRYAKLHNFNVLHSIGHSVLEASYKGLWANSDIAKAKNNIYGFGAYDSSPLASAKKFSSFAECIQIWSKWFNENYLEPWGQYYYGNCEKGVNFVYASSGIAGINKSFVVQQLRRQLNGIY